MVPDGTLWGGNEPDERDFAEVVARLERQGFRVKDVRRVRGCWIVYVESPGGPLLTGIGDDVYQALTHVLVGLDPCEAEGCERAPRCYRMRQDLGRPDVSRWRRIAAAVKARFLRWLNRCRGRRSR